MSYAKLGMAAVGAAAAYGVSRGRGRRGIGLWTMPWTEGPWRTHKEGKFTIVTGPDGRNVADLDIDKSNKTVAANAKLIAAAPDLYLALERLLKQGEAFLHQGADHDGLQNADALAVARVALREAVRGK